MAWVFFDWLFGRLRDGRVDRGHVFEELGAVEEGEERVCLAEEGGH